MLGFVDAGGGCDILRMNPNDHLGIRMNAELAHENAFASPTASAPPGRSFYRQVGLWILLATCVLAIVMLPIACLVGVFMGNSQVYNNLATHQQSRIEGVLREDPAAYGNLRVEHASNGWAYPSGTVATQEDYDRLSSRLQTMFGDELAEDMMRNVEVQVKSRE